jgi:hypothetical protein
MIKPTVRPALDPLAHKAAIDALEAQRAAYRRFARTGEGQRLQINDGDGDKALAAGAEAARGFEELTDGARKLEPALREVRDAGSAEQLQEVERRMEELMRDARQAEAAIQNLSLQLEAWRDAYGRQLAELGLAPGSAGDGAPAEPAAPGREQGAAHGGPYVQPGFGRGRGASRPTLIDRRG